MPTTADGWEGIAQNFKSKWDFPQCIGALDGKHIQIIKPCHSGSDFLNYKKTFSIVFLALVDANYNFMYVDVGIQSRISDGGVFKNTNLYRLLTTDRINLPPAKPLPGRQQLSQYVIVADDAFALGTHLLKPYPGAQITGNPERIFNYRLSRIRVVAEIAFGIITAKFRVLRQPILLSPTKASAVTLACIYLHNFLRRNTNSINIYGPVGLTNTFNSANGQVIPENSGESYCNLIPLQRQPRRDRVDAMALRDEFKNYFITDLGSMQC